MKLIASDVLMERMIFRVRASYEPDPAQAWIINGSTQYTLLFKLDEDYAEKERKSLASVRVALFTRAHTSMHIMQEILTMGEILLDELQMCKSSYLRIVLYNFLATRECRMIEIRRQNWTSCLKMSFMGKLPTR